MSDHLTKLRERLAELSDLRNAQRLLQWDQQTMMPPRGGTARADALATVERMSHDLFVSDETGALLDAAAETVDGMAPDSDDASLVRVVRRRWEKTRRVPGELAAELAHAASVGQEAWVDARARSDFAAFLPYLKRNLELTGRYIDCMEGFERPYDAVLDDYEPGMKSSEVSRLFEELKSLVPMIATFSERSAEIDDSVLNAPGGFPIDAQRRLVAEVVERMGFDRQGWRMDDAVHPFAISLGSADVRITTRWDESYFASGLYGAMHECGHGLYEAGIAPQLQRTPLGSAESLGLHESQSRLWENMVGRSREFTRFLAPHLVAHFPKTVEQVDPESLFRAVNRVQPSLIRVEADEATYGLHIVLRFELEQELLEGRLAAEDLTEAWNARFKQYLGLDVPDDAHGVLQDVHWAAGLFGYFPTYAIGNMIAGQLWERASADLPGLGEQMAVGELAPLREWLRSNIHVHGSKFTTGELLERVVGGPIVVAPFVAYLQAKLGEVYG
jgi:carboxypeptidase Taq